MASLGLYLSSFVRRVYLDSLEQQMAAEARQVADVLAPRLATRQPDTWFDADARRYADLLGARVTLIAPDGLVLGESHEERALMDNHLLRPEVQAALTKGLGSSIRRSRTVGYEMLYVAVPVTTQDGVVGVARVALPLDQVARSINHLRTSVLLATLVAVALAAGLALLIAERTARPVRRLTAVVERMAAGDLDARLLPASRDEVGTLTRAFNQLGAQLKTTITTLSAERSRLEGVLEHMADGVVITDATGHVRLVNPAAARVLGVQPAQVLGATLAQAARDHRLIALWQRCRDRGEEQVEAVDIGQQGPFVQAIVTPLRDGEPGACLMILQDLTRIRRLETVRRDFISNISHELRTPLAALKALVDTLRDGALDDPPAAARFLDRMETEVDALAQIVQELLELSRIESGQVPLRLAPVQVADAVLPAVERLAPLAERAGLALEMALPDALPPALADVERIQQVVGNLLHNAIKFTPQGGHVRITVGVQGRHVVVSVADDGVGIPADDLPRIFERFYKADRARSGGGTGLGLAIAKHIVQAHGGQIWAESTEGRGSTFYFSLPLADEDDTEREA